MHIQAIWMPGGAIGCGHEPLVEKRGSYDGVRGLMPGTGAFTAYGALRTSRRWDFLPGRGPGPVYAPGACGT